LFLESNSVSALGKLTCRQVQFVQAEADYSGGLLRFSHGAMVAGV
jgi:hypothetical protein